MRRRLVKMNLQDQEVKSKEAISLPGYSLFPPDEDIYRQFRKMKEVDPEDISHLKMPNEEDGARNEKDFSEDPMSSGLDVPGSKLEDQQKRVGSEENSLGGDNHN